MKSFLEVNGVYNPALRFAFTNITEGDFVSAWNGSAVTIKPGQTVELPHHLAVKFTGELVDKIIMGNAKLDEVTKAKEGYRSPIGMSLGVPTARKIWEDQILRELAVDEESPQVQVIRAQIREELERDLKVEKTSEPVSVPTSLAEFAELGVAEAPKVKKELKVKTIKAPK